MPAKKAAGTRRAPAKKTVPKKRSAAKRTTRKTPARKATTRKRNPKGSVTISAKKQTKQFESVTTPATLPKRAKEKVLVLENWLFGRGDELFIRTARYTGLFFVVFGGLLTMWSMTGISQPTMQLAATWSSSTTTDTTSTWDSSSSTVDPEPHATFDVSVMTSNPSLLTVHVMVPYAQEVKVMALKTETNTVHTIGFADRVEPEHWQYDWNTLDYPNGEYKLMAEITNEFGAYVETDSTTYTVYNESNDPSLVPSLNDVSFSLQEGAVVSGNKKVVMEAPGYEEATLAVREVATGNVQQLDLVLHDANNARFEFKWPTELYPNGEYALEAMFYHQGSAGALQGPTVVVENAIVSEPSTSDPDKNDLTFSLHNGDTLVGDVEVAVEAPGFEIVEAFVVSRSDNVETPLEAFFTDTTSALWEFLWPTTEFADGEYDVYALVSHDGTTEKVSGPRVNIDNTTDTTGSELNPVETTESTNETIEQSDAVVESDAVTAEPPRLRVPSGPLSGSVTMRIDARAEFIEIYARAQLSTTRTFLGLAKRDNSDPGRWEFVYDVRHLPNGTYGFLARAKTSEKFLLSEPVVRSIYNEPVVPTTSETTSTAELEPVVTETESEVTFVSADEGIEDTTDEEARVATDALLADFREEIDAEMARFTTAIRSQDEVQVERARERVQALRDRIIASALTDEQAARLIDRIEERIQSEFDRIETKIRTIEALIRERTEGRITTDTDGDGITDYDEVHLYQTDPNLPDTDNDGFNDGVEILEGYDPLDPSREAVVRHESPKESGIVRDDLLKVSEISTSPSETGEAVQPVFRGTALPNSYVTLYVYSTPTIVTIRTEPDGSWTYRFDKELEDGEHEVYVGVTDNAGRVVAKSRPFTFVKEAQAYTPVDAATASVTTDPPETIASTNNLLTVISIAVVAIGLVLILIGWNLDATRPKVVTGNAAP